MCNKSKVINKTFPSTWKLIYFVASKFDLWKFCCLSKKSNIAEINCLLVCVRSDQSCRTDSANCFSIKLRSTLFFWAIISTLAVSLLWPHRSHSADVPSILASTSIFSIFGSVGPYSHFLAALVLIGAPLQRKLNSRASRVGLIVFPLSRSWLCSRIANELSSWVIGAFDCN